MEFRILGPLEVLDGGRPLAIRRGKEQALLAYMLLHANEVVPTGRLIDVLWDERPPPTASKVLQNAVSHLRRQLGDGRLLTREPGYVLRVEAGELDAREFERLTKDGHSKEALSLWRGPPLLELQDGNFIDDARRRFEELRLGALEDRVEEDLGAGRHADLVPELEQLAAEHPLRERIQGMLMRALYGAGRQADALEAYRQARRTLSDELGLEPGPQLQELERKILTQDPELSPVALPRRRSQLPQARRRLRVALFGVAGGLLLAALIVGILEATGGDGAPIVATKNSLAVVDPGSNRVVGVIPIGGTPRGVTVGTQHVWAANAGESTVSEIDPKTLRVVQVIGLGAAATDLVEADGEVWVATGVDNTVVRIDARSGGILGTIKISRDLSSSAYAIAASAGAVWVASGNSIYKIDPSTKEIVSSSKWGAGINDVAVHAGSIWIATSFESVTRISMQDFRDTGQAVLGVIPASLAIAHGSVWVGASAPYGSAAALWRLDESTARVTQTIVFKRAIGYPPTVQVAYGFGAIWVATWDDGSLVRVDPDDGSILARINVGGHPSGVAVGKDRVWVTVS
jgi:DNA-binding SARP family transcriptional activator/DNA-binding beta-propeller fold protein YncE